MHFWGKLGIEWDWKDEKWQNYYYIGNTNIIDAAVYWKENCYIPNSFMCLSFQFQKHLNIGKGGMILTDDKNASIELKKCLMMEEIQMSLGENKI